MEIEVDASELVYLAKRMEDRRRRIRRKIRKAGREAAPFLRESLVRHASGRPGPNVETGQYISSFYAVLEESAEDAVLITAGNPSPQAARLEYGFFGIDSAGRNYAQPAYPHFRPALLETQEWYLHQMKQILKEELG